MKKIILVSLCCLFSAFIFSNSVYAERSAIIFIEGTHEDYPLASEWELSLVYSALHEEDKNLLASYDTFYWLVNIEATRDGFLEAVTNAVNNSDAVDVYLIAHGGTKYFWGHYDNIITTDDVRGLAANENMKNLRVVWNGSCHSYEFTDEFLDIGAISAIGNDNFSNDGVFFKTLIKNFRIESGKMIGESVEIANKASNQGFTINGCRTTTMLTPSQLESPCDE